MRKRGKLTRKKRKKTEKEREAEEKYIYLCTHGMARSERSKPASQIENRRQSERIRVVIIRVSLVKSSAFILGNFTLRFLHPLSSYIYIHLFLSRAASSAFGISRDPGNISLCALRKHTHTRTSRLVRERGKEASTPTGRRYRRLRRRCCRRRKVEKKEKKSRLRELLDTLFSPRTLIPLAAERERERVDS